MTAFLICASCVPVAYVLGFRNGLRAKAQQARRDAESMKRHASLRSWPPHMETESERDEMDAQSAWRRERDEAR